MADKRKVTSEEAQRLMREWINAHPFPYDGSEKEQSAWESKYQIKRGHLADRLDWRQQYEIGWF